jgi:hypothetical protein
VFGIDYNFAKDALYVGTNYKNQGKIRIYTISSNMAEKLFEILVPTNDSFLVYPFAQKIYQSSGYQISYDDKKPDHEAIIFYDENYLEASKWKLGSSELNTFYYDKKLNMIVVDK